MLHVNTSMGRFWADPKEISFQNRGMVYADHYHIQVCTWTRIISTARVCSVTHFHTMNFHKKNNHNNTLTDSGSEGSKIKCEWHKWWTSEEHADNGTFVFNTGCSTSYFFYYFQNSAHGQMIPSDLTIGACTNTSWLDHFIECPCKSGFEISNKPSEVKIGLEIFAHVNKAIDNYWQLIKLAALLMAWSDTSLVCLVRKSQV